MSEGNVVDLFGNRNGVGSASEVERGLEDKVTSDDILNKCKEAHLKEVLVIGLNEEGMLGVSTNLERPSDIIYLIERVKFLLFSRG